MQDLILPSPCDPIRPLAKPHYKDSAGGEPEDVCCYLFELCRRLDHSFMRQRGITCMFDVHSGWLGGARCRILGLMVAALVIEVVTHARSNPEHGVITVSAFLRDRVWFCSVADRGVYAVRAVPSSPPDLVKRMAHKLSADLEHRAFADGAVTSFLFAAVV